MALPHRCRHGHRLVDRHIDHLARRLVLDLVDVAADGVELEESLFCESMSDDQSNNNKSVYMLFSTSVFFYLLFKLCGKVQILYQYQM